MKKTSEERYRSFFYNGVSVTVKIEEKGQIIFISPATVQVAENISNFSYHERNKIDGLLDIYAVHHRREKVFAYVVVAKDVECEITGGNPIKLNEGLDPLIEFDTSKYADLVMAKRCPSCSMVQRCGSPCHFCDTLIDYENSINCYNG